MAAVNPTLNAVVLELAEQARAEADTADAELARGEPVGALHGVPVTIKVNTDQAGCPTDNAVAAFKDLVAGRDSPTVANFPKAGAIVVGRPHAPCLPMPWLTETELPRATPNPRTAHH